MKVVKVSHNVSIELEDYPDGDQHRKVLVGEFVVSNGSGYCDKIRIGHKRNNSDYINFRDSVDLELTARQMRDRKRLSRPEREVALALQLAIWALGRAGSDFAAEHIRRMVSK